MIRCRYTGIRCRYTGIRCSWCMNASTSYNCCQQRHWLTKSFKAICHEQLDGLLPYQACHYLVMKGNSTYKTWLYLIIIVLLLPQGDWHWKTVCIGIISWTIWRIGFILCCYTVMRHSTVIKRYALVHSIWLDLVTIVATDPKRVFKLSYEYLDGLPSIWFSASYR